MLISPYNQYFTGYGKVFQDSSSLYQCHKSKQKHILFNVHLKAINLLFNTSLSVCLIKPMEGAGTNWSRKSFGFIKHYWNVGNLFSYFLYEFWHVSDTAAGASEIWTCIFFSEKPAKPKCGWAWAKRGFIFGGQKRHNSRGSVS